MCTSLLVSEFEEFIELEISSVGSPVVSCLLSLFLKAVGLYETQVVLNSYSCALERSFLYHGRMFVSAWHICFHSNVFSKQLKVRANQSLNFFPGYDANFCDWSHLSSGQHIPVANAGIFLRQTRN